MTSIIQFLGFLFFLSIALSGFWCLSFLIAVVPYWITAGLAELYGKTSKGFKAEEVKRKTLPEQESVSLVWKK